MTLVDDTGRLLNRRPGRKLSEVLRDLRARDDDRISVCDLVRALCDRSFAPLMVILAALNMFLFIPGSSVFTGLPLIGLATLAPAIFLFLSIRFANGLPALSIILLAFDLSERDGIWLTAGLILIILSIFFISGMVLAGGVAILNLM